MFSSSSEASQAVFALVAFYESISVPTVVASAMATMALSAAFPSVVTLLGQRQTDILERQKMLASSLSQPLTSADAAICRIVQIARRHRGKSPLSPIEHEAFSACEAYLSVHLFPLSKNSEVSINEYLDIQQQVGDMRVALEKGAEIPTADVDELISTFAWTRHDSKNQWGSEIGYIPGSRGPSATAT